MKRKAKAIREGIKNIGELLYCVKNNELRDVFYRYSDHITVDFIDFHVTNESVYPVTEQTTYPVHIEGHKEVDTVSYIRREIYYVN